jgi:hypothetical protein
VASGIRVTATTDSKDWSLAIDHLAVIIEAHTADASMDAAALIEGITKAKLAERSHGPLTFSPSPRGAGQPPAMVSGNLAASISHASDGFTGAMVGPTAGYGRSGDYARIQELGGTMEGHPYMRFMKVGFGNQFRVIRDGQTIFSGASKTPRTIWLESIVHLTPRPYLEPATEEAVNSGRVRDIYAQWWADAIEQGAG